MKVIEKLKFLDDKFDKELLKQKELLKEQYEKEKKEIIEKKDREMQLLREEKDREIQRLKEDKDRELKYNIIWCKQRIKLYLRKKNYKKKFKEKR